MKKIKIGFDKHQDKDIFKIAYEPHEAPGLQLFNSDDIIRGNPSSNIVIGFVYNWKEDKPPAEVMEFFKRISNYAYITGLWKTTNGARYVFSNILANPNVNKMVLLVFGAKDNGHMLVDACVNFWKNGVDENLLIKGSKAPNPTFEQVSREGLERLRKQADLVVMRDVKDTKQVENLVKLLLQEPENAKAAPDGVEFYSLSQQQLYDDGARFDEPMHLDLSKSARRVEFIKKYSKLPLGQSVHADDLEEALEMVTAFVYEHGQMFRDQRGVITMESRSFTVTIIDALKKIPDNYSNDYIDKYVREFMEGVGEGLDEFAYTYHERIFKKWGNQVERAVALLKKSPDTRRCLISLWDPAKDLDSQSPPCLDYIWLVVRDGKLEMHVVYRSHHISTVTRDGKLLPGEGALVPNLYALGTLQEDISKKIGVPRGSLVLNDFSAHLYVSEVK
jgi:thymidylate synthase